MKVISYIKEFGLDKLNEEFAIKIKRYPQDIVMLNYDQLNSPSSHPIVMECRSLILHLPTLQPLSRAFDRFFNYGETPAVNKAFCFQDFVAWEKIDGSLIPVYWNSVSQRWEIATKGTAFGEGWVDETKTLTYRGLILDRFFDNNEEKFQAIAHDAFDKSNTYCFELAGPSAPHYTPYDSDFLAGLSIRNVLSGEHLSHEEQQVVWDILNKKHGLAVRAPQRWTFSSEQDMLNALKSIRGLQEGFVLEDKKSGLRMKAKTKGFLAAMHLRSTGEVNETRAATLVVTGEYKEWLAYNPQDQELFDPLAKGYFDMRNAMLSLWKDIQHIENPKDFAMAAKDHPFSSVMFLARKQNSTPVEAFEQLPENSQAKMLLDFMKKA